MIGEGLALLAACSFALAGVAIAGGAPRARGDNGAFLSIVLTGVLAGILWMTTGSAFPRTLSDPQVLAGIAIFILAGVLSIVLGRLAMFRAVTLAGAISASIFRRLIPIFAGVLAWLLLGERPGLLVLAGMGVIMLGVLLAVTARMPAQGKTAKGPDPTHRRRGQAYGAASAACYGGSYVARKLGMGYIPDAALGALIGAVTGIVWYLVAALGSRGYRDAVLGVVRDTGPWQFVTALAMAVGQTSLFFALKYADVAVVAIIGATEVFISAILAGLVFRTEPPPGGRVIAASALAFGGVVVIALS